MKNTQTIAFAKYHGTGNDFILIDNRQARFSFSKEEVAALCHRRFGIGADGLMLLENAKAADFKMVYYNADGGISTLCGNGSRCIVAFAQHLGMLQGEEAVFEAADGLHQAQLLPDGNITIEMQNVDEILPDEEGVFLDTGSPHLVIRTPDARGENVCAQGRELRNVARFAPGGTNVNFVEKRSDGSLYVRTYERGVEDETLSCGTGVTAAAIASVGDHTGGFHIPVETPGGMLGVRFQKTDAGKATNIYLTGPAQFVFEGRCRYRTSRMEGNACCSG